MAREIDSESCGIETCGFLRASAKRSCASLLEMCGDVWRCMEMWRDVWRCMEMWGDVGRVGVRPRPGATLTHTHTHITYTYTYA
eukprot:scaffold110342_cov81-Phaeocystis_antarctica.AAC.1